jgi:hypothetical protein
MIDQINHDARSQAVVPHFGFWIGKFSDIVTNYETFFPSGKLSLYLRACIGGLVVGLIGVAICLMLQFR